MGWGRGGGWGGGGLEGRGAGSWRGCSDSGSVSDCGLLIDSGCDSDSVLDTKYEINNTLIVERFFNRPSKKKEVTFPYSFGRKIFIAVITHA